jgi:hypothetical protein
MREQQKKSLHQLVTAAPRSVWRSGLFVVPALLTVASLGLFAYLRTQVSDLEIVFRHEYKIVRVWNAEQVAKILPALGLLLTMLLGWIAGLGWLAYEQTQLLKAAAPYLGIEGEGASEFWKRRAEIGRDLRKSERGTLMGFFIGLGAFWLLAVGWERWGGTKGEALLFFSLMFMGFFGLIALVSVKSNSAMKAIMRKHGLECSQCGWFPRLAPRGIDQALEAGVCGKCGGRLGAGEATENCKLKTEN